MNYIYTCQETCKQPEEVTSSNPPLNELLKKLDDLSNHNLDLATSISNNLFGRKSDECCPPMPSVDCMEDTIKIILENAYKTNTLLSIIRDRL